PLFWFNGYRSSQRKTWPDRQRALEREAQNTRDFRFLFRRQSSETKRKGASTGGRHRIRHPELPFRSTRTPRDRDAASSCSTSSWPLKANGENDIGIALRRATSHCVSPRASSASRRPRRMISAAKVSETRPASSYIATFRLLRAAATRVDCSRTADGTPGNEKR